MCAMSSVLAGGRFVCRDAPSETGLCSEREKREGVRLVSIPGLLEIEGNSAFAVASEHPSETVFCGRDGWPRHTKVGQSLLGFWIGGTYYWTVPDKSRGRREKSTATSKQTEDQTILRDCNDLDEWLKENQTCLATIRGMEIVMYSSGKEENAPN